MQNPLRLPSLGKTRVQPVTLLSALASLLASLLANPAAFAIKGTYLPESELSKSTCKIKLDRMVISYTPSHQNGVPNGLPVYKESIHNLSMCSSTLVAPNTLITAAHCFIGNNEQNIKKGTFLYPNLNAQGELVPGCTAETWRKKDACIAGKVYGVVSQKWEGLAVECPTLDGKTESRPLNELSGYPNPLFRADADSELTMKNFDLAVWRVEKPFTQTPTMEVEYDFNRMLSTLKKSGQSCRSYGYGLDNDDKSGTLRGTITPITAASERVLISDLAPSDYGVVTNGGRVDHGDSGGTLTCVDETGKEKLFGVVSRGGLDFGVGLPYSTELSIYSLPSYNATWIQHVLKNGPLVRDASKKWWYDFTVGYHQSVLEETLSLADQCIEENRREMGREVYRNFYKKAYRDLEQKYAAAQAEARGYGNDSGLLRSRMREILDLTKRLLSDCKARHF